MDVEPPAHMDVAVRVCRRTELDRVKFRFPALNEDRDSTLLVAWADGVAVGHVQIGWAGSVHEAVRNTLGVVPEVWRLRVHPEARRRGVASSLLEEAERIVAERTIDRIGLAVGLSNGPARWMYERAGYVDAGFTPFESPFGLDDAGMPYRHLVGYMVKDGLTRELAHETGGVAVGF